MHTLTLKKDIRTKEDVPIRNVYHQYTAVCSSRPDATPEHNDELMAQARSQSEDQKSKLRSSLKPARGGAAGTTYLGGLLEGKEFGPSVEAGFDVTWHPVATRRSGACVTSHTGRAPSFSFERAREIAQPERR